MAGIDERKRVTVLFVDLAGSTGLATRHDSEHFRALLSTFFDEMRQHVEAFDGTVGKYGGRGDGRLRRVRHSAGLRVGVATGEAVAATESVESRDMGGGPHDV